MSASVPLSKWLPRCPFQLPIYFPRGGKRMLIRTLGLLGSVEEKPRLRLEAALKIGSDKAVGCLDPWQEFFQRPNEFRVLVKKSWKAGWLRSKTGERNHKASWLLTARKMDNTLTAFLPTSAQSNSHLKMGCLKSSNLFSSQSPWQGPD